MTERSREKDLRTLLAEMSGQDISGVGPDDDLEYALGLDSLARLRLLATVEKRCSVRFPDDRLGDIRTLNQLLDFIERQ